jgi:hypothetical protein
MNDVKSRLLAISTILVFMVLPDIAVSCPVCFGDKASAEVEGAKWAILFLLGVTGTVLSGVVTFVIYLRKRSGQNLAGTDQNHFNREL